MMRAFLWIYREGRRDFGYSRREAFRRASTMLPSIGHAIERNPGRAYRLAGIICILAALATFALMTAYGRTPAAFVGLAIVGLAAEGIRRAGAAIERQRQREREIREAEGLESIAMHDEIDWLDKGDYEEAAVADVAAYVYGQRAARLRQQKNEGEGDQ